ncbi:MAG: sigma-70 family RNA polymerase sigma factor [bacterium]|nr:sigma-70 family RNA polymerase sigma factor [bacterium]
MIDGDVMQPAMGITAALPEVEPVPTEPLHPDVLSLQLWKNGNMRGYNQIVERYQKPLFHFIYRMVRDMEESKDILQETFVRMYKYKERFEEEKSLKSWLYQTANNLCIDYYRKHKPGRVNFFDQQDSTFSALVESSGIERERQPDEVAQDRHLQELVLQAIEQLPKKQKMVMTLRSCKNLSLKEIADVMGCTQQTVGTTLFAARKKLIQLLSPVLQDLYGCSADQLL